jgi:hypothetical protein
MKEPFGRHKTGPCMRQTWLESNYQFAKLELSIITFGNIKLPSYICSQ